MAQDTLYTTAQAARLAGVSKPAVRLYAGKYSAWLSPDAKPEPGQERRFTVDDLRLLRFVFECTQAKDTHATVLARLASGELDAFTWTPPEPGSTPNTPVEPQEGTVEPTNALVPMAQVYALQAMLEDARRRELDALEREQAAQERLRELERELGRAQGELDARRRKRPAWLRSLFGE